MIYWARLKGDTHKTSPKERPRTFAGCRNRTGSKSRVANRSPVTNEQQADRQPRENSNLDAESKYPGRKKEGRTVPGKVKTRDTGTGHTTSDAKQNAEGYRDKAKGLVNAGTQAGQKQANVDNSGPIDG